MHSAGIPDGYADPEGEQEGTEQKEGAAKSEFKYHYLGVLNIRVPGD